MIGLGLLVVLVVVLVVVAVAFGASRARTAGRDRTVAPEVSEVVGEGSLDRWVAAGLISGEQARAIVEFETARTPARARPRVSPAVEALAYVGGILLAVGAAMLIAQFWKGLGVGGRIGVLAAASVLTGVVGTVVGESDAVTWRLRGFLWALAAVGAAAVGGLFVFEVLDVSGAPVAVAAAGCGAVVSAACWQLRNRPLQHLLTLVGVAAASVATLLWIGSEGLAAGLLLWSLGALWAWLGWSDRIPPGPLGFVLGIALTLIGAGVVGSQVEWLAPLLGLATAAAWIAVGVVRGDRLALVPGILGVFVFLPWTLGYFFGETVGAPVVAMSSGAVLLAIVLLLVRRGRRGGSRDRRRASAYPAAP